MQAQRKLLVDYFYVLTEIEADLQQGKKIAIRDLGLLLDKPSIKRQALAVFQKYTAFTPREFTLSAYSTKEQVLNFYYENETAIQFSELLDIFYITPFEERSVYYTLEAIEVEESIDRTTRLRQHILRLQQDIETGSIESAKTQIERIGNLGLEEGYLFLLNQLEQQTSRRRGADNQLYASIIKAIAPLKDRRVVQVILDLAKEEKIQKETAIEQLVKITNQKVTTQQPLTTYQTLLDSLGSVAEMRANGYHSFFTLRPYFFDDPVDYYGKILIQSDSIDWIKENALQDLLDSEHSRSLYYLAIQAYRFTKLKQPENAAITHQILQRLVAAQVKIHNWRKEFITEPDWADDPKAVFNYLIYWSSHHQDYTWDSNRGKFINKTISLTVEQKLKLSIRRLTSANDSVAMESYLNLVRAKPAEMIPLIGQFRPILRNHNTNLPPIEFYYLEQLSRLVDFCERNNFTYVASDEVNERLQTLIADIPPSERYALEKAIVKSIALNEISAIEYWAMLNAANQDVLFSAGWILNKIYSKYWSAIQEDEKQLRLYLKKSYLFNRIGTLGICKVYLSKIDADNATISQQLKRMLKFETDEDVIYQVKQLLNDVETVELYNWKDLTTTDFDFSLLPKPSTSDYEAITKAILNSNDERDQLNLILYLGLHAELAQVPYLIQLLKASKVTSEALAILEKIYAYDFQERGNTAKDRWLNFWQTDSLNYTNWGTAFIEFKLEQLNRSNRLSINDINSITTSSFYQPAYRRFCLEALKKVNPRYIRRLKIEPKPTVSGDLQYIETLNFRQRDLVNVLELFHIDDVQKTIEYIQRKIDRFSSKQQGAVFCDLFELEWFEGHLLSNEIKKSLLKDIQKSLTAYLETASHPTVQERALIAIAKLEGINKTIEQQLQYSFKLDATEKVKAQIQQNILQKVTYAQIPAVLRTYNRLSPELDYNFLLENFGLPIFDYSNASYRAELAANLLSMSKEDFYRHCLRSFGVDFEQGKANEKLDFEKIATILRYDLTPAFAGSASYRNYHVSGITRLLAIHFGQQLSLIQTVNTDLPTSVVYWIKYMEQRRIIKTTQDQSFSFAVAYAN